jgi:hypothetical protein
MQRAASFALARNNSFRNRDLFGGGADDVWGAQCNDTDSSTATAEATASQDSLATDAGMFFNTQQLHGRVRRAAGSAAAASDGSTTPLKDASPGLQRGAGGGGLAGIGMAAGDLGPRGGSSTNRPAPVSTWRAAADEYELPKPDPTAFDDREWATASDVSRRGGVRGGNPPTPPTYSSTASSPLYHVRQQPPEITRTRKIARSSSLTQTKVLLDMHPQFPLCGGEAASPLSFSSALSSSSSSSSSSDVSAFAAALECSSSSLSSSSSSSSSSFLLVPNAAAFATATGAAAIYNNNWRAAGCAGAGAGAAAAAAAGRHGNASTRMELHRDFETLATIGCGNFSQVYKVRWRRNNKLYAVKKSLQPFRSRRDRDNYQKEVKAYYQLGPSCPHIIQYFCAWQEDGHFLVQMELCARGNLASFLKHLTTPVPVRAARAWCA